jgi:sarcosine oxidase subunit beta
MTHNEIVVVGAGVVGLSIAYNLMKKKKDVRVIEKSYLNAGSTGRNIGIIRERIPHKDQEKQKLLSKIAIMGAKMHASLPSQTGINTFYRQSGRLSLAMTEKETEVMDKETKVYAEMGEHIKKMSPNEIERKWRYVSGDAIKAGYYSHSEAMSHPFGLTWAYLEALKEANIPIEKLNKVNSVQEKNGQYLIKSEKGEYTADKVVIAANVYTKDLIEPMGYNIDITPYRKEVVISEPMRPFFGPTIDRPNNGYIIAQTMRGEILGTIGEEKPSKDLTGTTSTFLNKFADETLRILPTLKDLRIIRQWIGITEKTKDEVPLVGALNKDLWIACGFHIYGVTMAPIIGKLLAESIISGKENDLLKPFNPLRF